VGREQECPATDGPALPLTDVKDLLVLPSGTGAVEGVRAGRDPRSRLPGCNPDGVTTDIDGGEGGPEGEITGVLRVVPPDAPDPYRELGREIPGIQPGISVDGIDVDVWRMDGPWTELRAYWTAPDGRRWGLHVDRMTEPEQHLEDAIHQINTDAEARASWAKGPQGPIDWVRVTLPEPDGGSVALQVVSTEVWTPLPVGTRQIEEPGLGMVWWYGSKGVGRLDWIGHPPETGGTPEEPENGSAEPFQHTRSLWGENLTLERALEIAKSLTPVQPTDPRLSPKRP
jgi:hypothetical protein